MHIRILEQFSRSGKHPVFLLVIAMLMIAGNKPCYAEDKVVLIAAKPVINLYNRKLYEDFLKNVMYMTEGAYKRKIVKRIFRNGTEKIQEIEMLNELNKHLTSNIGDISFVYSDTVEQMHDIEVVKVLW